MHVDSHCYACVVPHNNYCNRAGTKACGLNDVQSVSSYSGNSASYAVLNSICSSVGYVSHVPDGWIKVRNRVTC